MSPVVVIFVTVVPVYDPPTATGLPLAALAAIGGPSALATSAAAPPSDAARIVRRDRGVAGSSDIRASLEFREGGPRRSAAPAGASWRMAGAERNRWCRRDDTTDA